MLPYFSKFSSFKDYASDLANLVNHISKPVLLWIDQSLGGGTLSYSLNKFNEYKDDFLIIRLQYHHLYRAFVVSCPNGEMYTGFSLSFEDINEFSSGEVLCKSTSIVKDHILLYKVLCCHFNIQSELVFGVEAK